MYFPCFGKTCLLKQSTKCTDAWWPEPAFSQVTPYGCLATCSLRPSSSNHSSLPLTEDMLRRRCVCVLRFLSEWVCVCSLSVYTEGCHAKLQNFNDFICFRIRKGITCLYAHWRDGKIFILSAVECRVRPTTLGLPPHNSERSFYRKHNM